MKFFKGLIGDGLLHLSAGRRPEKRNWKVTDKRGKTVAAGTYNLRTGRGYTTFGSRKAAKKANKR